MRRSNLISSSYAMLFLVLRGSRSPGAGPGGKAGHLVPPMGVASRRRGRALISVTSGHSCRNSPNCLWKGSLPAFFGLFCICNLYLMKRILTCRIMKIVLKQLIQHSVLLPWFSPKCLWVMQKAAISHSRSLFRIKLPHMGQHYSP